MFQQKKLSFNLGGILKPCGPLGGAGEKKGVTKSPRKSTRGMMRTNGAVHVEKCPKIGPHGLRMSPYFQ